MTSSAEPATGAPQARATYQDVLDAPAHLVAELIGGTLYTHRRPAPLHARTGARLLGKLGPPFDEGDNGPGGWLIFYEPEVHLVDEVVVLDLAGWRRERMPQLPETSYVGLAPDWVCPFLSTSTTHSGGSPRRWQPTTRSPSAWPTRARPWRQEV